MGLALKNKLKQTLARVPFLYQAAKYVYGKAKRSYEWSLSVLFAVFPVVDNKIVIINYRGKGYGDNAKYIVDGLLKSDLDVEIVWLIKKEFESSSGLPEIVRTVRFGSLKSLYEIATAKLWIDNNRFSFYVNKRKKQRYIQTWHGGLGLKKIEADAPYGQDAKYIRFAKRDSKLSDLYISNSKHLSDIYKRAFWYGGEILESGYPKNDILFESKELYRNKIREEYGLSEETKLLLYAPTFRDNHNLNPYDINLTELKNQLNTHQDEDWVIAARLHPNIDGICFAQAFQDGVINVTDYPDMQELIMGVDILVTDYSSCMFDSAIAKIPTFIYASDVDEYLDNRGFYFSLDDLPFKAAQNTQELIENISTFNEKESLRDLECFYQAVGLYDDGNASQKVVNAIKKMLF